MLWRGRRWRRLLNLIEQLPRNSSYMEALVLDDEVALQMLRSSDGRDSAPKRRMSEWSAEVELLSAIADRVTELIQATLAGHGAKPREVRASPRPETALNRARQRERIRKHHYLVSKVLPPKPELGGPPPP